MNVREAERIAVREAAAAAGRTVAPAWPLSSFVAVNPLAGFENRRFEDALSHAAVLFRAPVLPTADDAADDEALDAALAEHARDHGDAQIRIGSRTIDATAIRRALLDGRLATPRALARERVAAFTWSETLGDWARTLGWGDVPMFVGERVARWLAAYLADGAAPWGMPYRERGFYSAWLALSRYERRGAHARRALPERADDLLVVSLQALGVPERLWAAYLARHLAQQPGWAGMVKRVADGRERNVDLVALLAIRVWYERCEIERCADRHGVVPRYSAVRDAVLVRTGTGGECADDEQLLSGLVAALAVDASELHALHPDDAAAALRIVRGFDATAQALVRLEARERIFEKTLLASLSTARRADASVPDAQFAFCIDARSEPFRRAIEQTGRGRYTTFGFAGFYGVPIRFRAFGDVCDAVQAPVLVKPVRTVIERPQPPQARRLRRTRALSRAMGAAVRSVAADGFAAFAAVEMLGPFAALRALLRTLVPERSGAAVTSAPLTVDRDGELGLPHEEQVLYAETALRMMGLTRSFAPLVFLCGHGGGTVNNAFAAALDCGACGGNRGLVNARVAAAILNREAVRLALQARGIAIPGETVFIGAEHDTTRDRLHVVVEDVHPALHAALVRAIADVERAGAAARTRRRATLPRSPFGADDPLERAGDWAQVRPEWGLARNAAFVCGPRELTRDADLDGRCFLHSYDPLADPDGVALEQILTAPLVVAQWINLQYFFASVDPVRWGSGDKMLQQPVGELGVVLGNGGDLRSGLPLQAVAVGDRPYHEPLRLLAVVAAPVARIDAIVARQRVLQRLFDNRWVRLIAVDPDDGRFRRYAGAGRWELIPAKEDACALPA